MVVEHVSSAWAARSLAACFLILLLGSGLTSGFGFVGGISPYLRRHNSALSSASSTAIPYEELSKFTKPLSDNRKYASVTLDNGLEVLLVSDPDTDVEAGAVHVKAGHCMDPEDRKGLAHFHEHMLFLGTEKYPGESDYESYLTENGGTSNAYTSDEDTNYYFSLNKPESEKDESKEPALYGALDRLAQFFISPLFTENCVEREIKAVDSEYSNSLTSDSWRAHQLLKHTSNHEHPFSNFGCGNYETLTNGGSRSEKLDSPASKGTNPRDDLKKFWERYYHAGNMKLVVVSRQHLSDLKVAVSKLFSSVRKSPSRFKVYSGVDGTEAFPPATLRKIRDVKPVKDLRKISISFKVPPVSSSRHYMRSKPQRLLSHLLGYEGRGSLHSVLLGSGFIRGLGAGVGLDGSDYSLFTLSLSLTEKGMHKRDEVISLCFQWLKLIESEFKTNPALFEEYHLEQSHLSEMFFKFSENTNPTDFASSAAETLFDWSANEVLSGPSLLSPFNATLFSAYINHFTASNCIITVTDPSLQEDVENQPSQHIFSASEQKWQEEPYYKSRYRERTFTDEHYRLMDTVERIDDRFRMPPKNMFIPTDFSLSIPGKGRISPEEMLTEKQKAGNVAPRGAMIPSVKQLKPNLKLYVRNAASTYTIPKTACYIHLTSPMNYFSPRSMTLCRLFERVLREDLNQYSYDASSAGCNFSVACHPSGFRIVLTGWSQKLPELVNQVTQRISDLLDDLEANDGSDPLARSFAVQTEHLLRETRNFAFEPPYELASYNSRFLLEERVWHVCSYEEVMENELSMKECANVVRECFSGRVDINALCMGNTDEDEAEALMETLGKNLGCFNPKNALSFNEFPQFKSLILPTKEEARGVFEGEGELVYPLVHQEIAASDAEENSAIEYYLQAGCDDDLQTEGVAILELICHLAYNSAYNQLRTKEQLGYIVSAYLRKSLGGGQGLAVTIQSNSNTPKELQGRIEAWVDTFRKELGDMSEEKIAMEGAAVVAQLMEKDMKLSHSVGRVWGEVSHRMLSKRPVKWDRLEEIAKCISNQDNLKSTVLEKFDNWFVGDGKRCFASWVHPHNSVEDFQMWKGKRGVLSSGDEVVAAKLALRAFPNSGLK